MSALPLDSAALDRYQKIADECAKHGDHLPYFPHEIDPLIAQARSALELEAQVERLEAERAQVRADALREAADIVESSSVSWSDEAPADEALEMARNLILAAATSQDKP